MVARQWRCICPIKHKDGFLDYLNQTGIKDSSSISGFKGSQIMIREADGDAEITLITYWDSLDSIRGFAGDDTEAARLYPEDQNYKIQGENHVTHYEVVQHSFKNSNMSD